MSDQVLPDDRADEVAELLVRVYEIHDVVVEETGGMPGLREASLLHAAVAEENMRISAGEPIRSHTIAPGDASTAHSFLYSSARIRAIFFSQERHILTNIVVQAA